MYPISAVQEAPGDDLSGSFLVFGNTSYRELRIQMLRIFVASVASVAITIVLLYATHDGALAKSPTRCGFWTEMEAGLSCR